MGPPLITWPYTHPRLVYSDTSDISDSDKESDNHFSRKCAVGSLVHNIRVICLNFTVAFVFLQICLSLNSVGAGPVVLNLDYLQGPVPLARNIRHLPCISRRTGQEGLCMFAIDCLKANGSHLGTCIDRFYFGSCCQIPDKTILPHVIDNIDDNSIDNANFVHPQTEDKVSPVSKVPEFVSPPKRTTTEKTVATTEEDKAETAQDRTEPTDLGAKTDEITTLDNKINDDTKITTAISIETTTKSEIKSSTPTPITELPVRLSTFQTVSSVNNLVTEKPVALETTSKAPTTIQEVTHKPYKPTPSRRPVKPTYKPRPYRPTNLTRPPYTLSTPKPKPIKPISSLFNSTRRPPYRPPPKRPSTKRPVPSPPRLNITILPQSTSSKPTYSRPSIPSITYINTTSSPSEPEPSTVVVVTTTTTTKAPTTERITETTEAVTETQTEPITERLATEQPTITTQTDEVKDTTVPLELTETTEKETTAAITEEATTSAPVTSSSAPVTSTAAPVTSSSAPVTSSSTEFPPFVTWTNTIDPVTKAPEKTTAADEIWSPITPPEGWILISTIPPKPETTSSTTTTTTTTEATTITEAPVEETTLAETTISQHSETESSSETSAPQITTLEPAPTSSEAPEPTTPSSESPSSAETPLSSSELPISSQPTTSTSSSEPSISVQTEKVSTTTTEGPLLEFTVNVTLSPTVPTTTASSGLTTFSSVSSENVTSSSTLGEPVGNNTTTQAGESSSSNATTEATTVITTTTEAYNMSDYKDVCGRRLWPQGRIVGGTKSAFGMWPWQISLRQYRTSTYLHKCGAALLNENWAITAAHCVEHVPPSELLVRLGEHDLANEDEPYGFAERRVQIVASHPHFDPATFEYDLALLRFYEPVTFQPNILPVCVPDNDEDYVGKTAYVTGWGRLYDDGPLPSVLQEVSVPVINNSACEAMYQAAGYNEHIPHIFICAGWKKGGADSCEGDSGGPMVLQRSRDSRFVLGGVISWGIGCAEPNQPGVYTRISEFRDWINQILQF